MRISRILTIIALSLTMSTPATAQSYSSYTGSSAGGDVDTGGGGYGYESGERDAAMIDDRLDQEEAAQARQMIYDVQRQGRGQQDSPLTPTSPIWQYY